MAMIRKCDACGVEIIGKTTHISLAVSARITDDYGAAAAKVETEGLDACSLECASQVFNAELLKAASSQRAVRKRSPQKDGPQLGG